MFRDFDLDESDLSVLKMLDNPFAGFIDSQNCSNPFILSPKLPLYFTIDFHVPQSILFGLVTLVPPESLPPLL